jgi:hypothetical protein
MNNNKIFNIEGQTLTYELRFEGSKLVCNLIRDLHAAEVSQITKISIKSSFLSAGDEVSFKLFYQDQGKSKSFPSIDAKLGSPITKEFLEELKSRLPSTAEWEDKTKSKAAAQKDEQGRACYDLQYFLFGYYGAGLPRTVQIVLGLVFFFPLIFPFVYMVYLLGAGGYRIYTGESGLEVKKMTSKKIAWHELENVEFQKVGVVDIRHFTKTNVVNVYITSVGRKKIKAVMRFDHATQLMKELFKRKVITQDVLDSFSV